MSIPTTDLKKFSICEVLTILKLIKKQSTQKYKIIFFGKNKDLKVINFVRKYVLNDEKLKNKSILNINLNSKNDILKKYKNYRNMFFVDGYNQFIYNDSIIKIKNEISMGKIWK